MYFLTACRKEITACRKEAKATRAGMDICKHLADVTEQHLKNHFACLWLPLGGGGGAIPRTVGNHRGTHQETKQKTI